MAKKTKASRGKDALDETTEAVRELARPHIAKALDALVDVVMHGEANAVKVAAARELLDRACGKTGSSGGASAEEERQRINETLALMRTRARRGRGVG